MVGPVQTDFGWAVAKVDSVKTVGGKTLDQARAEIAPKITADKRKGAIEELVGKVQDAVDNGSNFTEVAAQAKLTVIDDAADRRQRCVARGSEFQATRRSSRRR